MSDETRTKALVEQSQAALQAFYDAENKLRDMDLPKVIIEKRVDDHELDRFVIICPNCKHESETENLISVDIAERWTYFYEIDEEGVAPIFYDGHADWDGLGYMLECCRLFVDLPEGWEEETF